MNSSQDISGNKAQLTVNNFYINPLLIDFNLIHIKARNKNVLSYKWLDVVSEVCLNTTGVNQSEVKTTSKLGASGQICHSVTEEDKSDLTL